MMTFPANLKVEGQPTARLKLLAVGLLISLAFSPVVSAQASVETDLKISLENQDPSKLGQTTAIQLKADKVVVIKSKRELQLWHDDELLESFRVALGRQPKGHKAFEGDGRTPEGRYYLQGWKEDSNFYRAMHISYPNATDRAAANAQGRSPGGAIMLHGLAKEIIEWGSDHYMFNWTEGCIALTNEEMDIIWRRVRPGTPIDIMP